VRFFSLLNHLKQKYDIYCRQPRFIQIWLIPTWSFLGISRLLILSCKFRHIAPLLGTAAELNAHPPLLTPQEETIACKIARVVFIAARHTPWESNCFTQAITARALLGLYQIPYLLYFGLMRSPTRQTLEAHAWVQSGSVIVSGGNNVEQFTIVGCFITPPSGSIHT
jgi:hypothetical protein